MCRIGVFHHNRINCRQIGGNWDTIVEEAGIIQPTVLVVNVFLVQRPADALRHAALDLTFHVGGMYCPADILARSKAQDFDMTRVRVDLDIDHMRTNRTHVTACILRHGCHDRAASRQGFRCQFLQRQRIELARILTRWMRGTIGPLNGLDIDAPDTGRPAFQGFDDLICRLVDDDTRSEGHAATAGDCADTDIIGIADLGAHIAVIDAELLGHDVDHRCTATTDIRVPGDDQRRAIFVDVELGTRFATRVAPIADGYAAALVWSEFRFCIRVIADRIDNFLDRGLADLRTVNRWFVGGERIFQSQLPRVHAEFCRDFV